MITDRTTTLSKAQAITVTAASDNIIDLLAVGIPYKDAAALNRNLGLNHDINFVIQVIEQFTAAGAGTLTVAMQCDDDVAFGSPKTVWTSPVYTLAQLKPGARLNIDPHIVAGWLNDGLTERYMRLNYTVATGPMTAGKVFAGVVAGVQDSKI